MSHFWTEELPEANWYQDSYDLYGWAGELTYVNTQGFDHHFQLYRDMVAWIRENVKNPQQNVLWNKIGDCIYIQFRKQKDKNWFAMRFGT